MPTGKPTKMKPCKICKELFVPSTPSQRICNKDHIVKCPICGKDMIWNTTSKIIPCSKECKREYTKRCNIEKYGVDHPMKSESIQKKHKATMIERYGVEHALQSTELKQKAVDTNNRKFGSDWALSNPEIKDKARNTMIERYGAETTLQSDELKEKVHCTVVDKYGVDNVMQCDDIKIKAQLTNNSRYGVNNVMQCPEIAAKVSDTRNAKLQTEWKDEVEAKSKTTWLENLGVDNPSKSTDVIDKITDTFLRRYGVKRAIDVPEFREKMINTMIDRYGVPYYVQLPEASNNTGKISKVNLKFANKLDELNIPYEMEFSISTKSYDFHILDTNILIEIDPTYTHNIIGNHWNKNGLPKDYHLTKSNLAKENGYRCIHVFDWDDIDKILNLIRPINEIIYARNTQIYVLKPEYTSQFMNDYHIQKSCRGQMLCLGLVKNDVVYQVMTFGRPRYDKSHSIELLRLCTRPGYKIVGGASKLFKCATEMYELSNIVSYCDLSKFTGDVYDNIGMKLIRRSQPQEVWSKGTQKITANLLRQRGYDQLFNTSYGKGISNERLMLENGWLPVYDCGQAVYEY